MRSSPSLPFDLQVTLLISDSDMCPGVFFLSNGEKKNWESVPDDGSCAEF